MSEQQEYPVNIFRQSIFEGKPVVNDPLNKSVTYFKTDPPESRIIDYNYTDGYFKGLVTPQTQSVVIYVLAGSEQTDEKIYRLTWQRRTWIHIHDIDREGRSFGMVETTRGEMRPEPNGRWLRDNQISNVKAIYVPQRKPEE